MKKAIFFLLIPPLTLLYSSTVYIVPSSLGVNDEFIFRNDRDGCGLPMQALRDAIIQHGYKCITLQRTSRPEKNSRFIALEIPHDPYILKILSKCPKEHCILLLWEPPSVIPDNYNSNFHKHFHAVFTLFHELVDYKKYFPLYYPQPYLFMTEDIVPFNQKKLCTMVCGKHSSSHPQELYSKREASALFFENHVPMQFDLYGIGWDQAKYSCYRGKISHKLPYLRNYKFAICYENMVSQTYITEKIFDILHAGCIPIYWGAKKISQYIPYNAYILRERFASDADLYDFLNSMSQEEYQTYIDEGKAFFKNKDAQLFSISTFVNNILTILFAHKGVT